MYAVVRSYSGAGASELFDLLDQRKAEVESLIRSVSGFVSYSIVRMQGGGFTVTICESKTGTDESMELARNWIFENAPDLGLGPPTVTEGLVSLHLT